MLDENNNQAVTVFAPISIGNVSVGFDNLGLAVTPINGEQLGDSVTVSLSEDGSNHLQCIGSYADNLPQDNQENIVWQCLAAFEQQLNCRGLNAKKVKLILEKNAPISSGTGSSACSVVAALSALNKFYQSPLDSKELLNLMGELEASISGSLHYDNVAPCFLGGLQLMLDDPQAICQSLPTFDDCYWVICYPDIEVSTRKAREILPSDFSREDVIQSARLLAGFVDASYRQDKAQAFKVLRDVIAEPYRTRLLRHFDKTKQALLDDGCLSVGISGSGPTVFAACNSLSQAKQAEQIFDRLYQHSSNGFTQICQVDKLGARKI